MRRNIIVTMFFFMIGITIIYAQDGVAVDVITAEGDGTIALNGSGEVTLSGKGNLFIVDRTDKAMIGIESNRRRSHPSEDRIRDNLVYICNPFDGTATISGDDIAIVMEGIDIQISVSGTATIMLLGEGDYTLNHITTNWSTGGSIITLNMDIDD